MCTGARNVGNFYLAAYLLFCERERGEREEREREEGEERDCQRERERKCERLREREREKFSL